MPRERFDRASGFGRQEHVTSEIEQSSHFIAARDGFARTGLNRCRQIARDHRHDEEREERDPVLRIGNRQRAERWQEEEVEREGCGDCRDRGDPQPPERGGRQHVQEQHQRHRGRADLGERPQHEGNGRDREDAAEQYGDVASGERTGHRHADSLCHPA